MIIVGAVGVAAYSDYRVGAVSSGKVGYCRGRVGGIIVSTEWGKVGVI